MFYLCREILNGVITEDKVHRNLRRLGGGRRELWDVIAVHLKGLVSSQGAKPEELSHIFTAALVLHLPRGDEQHRAERKIHTLLNLVILPKEADSPSKDVTNNTTFSMDTSNSKQERRGSDASADAAAAPALPSPPLPAALSLKSEPASRMQPPAAAPSPALAASAVSSPTPTPAKQTPAKQTPAKKPVTPRDILSASSFEMEADASDAGSMQENILPPQGKTSPYSSRNVGSGRHQMDTDQASPLGLPKKGGNTSNTSINNSMTSSVPQASKLFGSKNAPPASKKWTGVKHVMTVEDDELASDEEILAPPPTKLLEENDEDSNEFDF
jgi:hypothetical protein